jgi:hypothetical protein
VVWEDWVVETVRARTGDPPPSHRTGLRLTPGTGISHPETGARKGDLSHTETKSETRRVPEKPRSGAISATRPVGVRALKTGWWRMQSRETGLQMRNREFSENFRPKQAFGGLTAIGHRKFRCDPRQLQHPPGTFLLLCKTGVRTAKTDSAKRNIRHLRPPNR